MHSTKQLIAHAQRMYIMIVAQNSLKDQIKYLITNISYPHFATTVRNKCPAKIYSIVHLIRQASKLQSTNGNTRVYQNHKK